MSDINEYPFNFDTPKADEDPTDEAIPEYSETTPNPSMSFDNIEDISLKSDYSFKGCNIEFSNSMRQARAPKECKAQRAICKKQKCDS